MKLLYPCDSRRITSPFGKRKIGDGFHDGIDFGALKQGVDGDKIYSAHDGIVARSYLSTSYGECIIINSDDGYSSIYAHLSQKKVKNGERVKAGQVIGLMGSTGNSTGTHLHFELRNIPYSSVNSTYFSSEDGRFPTAIDPLPFLKKKEDEEMIDKVTPVTPVTSIDNDKPSKYAEEAWKKATAKKIIDGKNPKGNLTREQLIIVLDRLGLL